METCLVLFWLLVFVTQDKMATKGVHWVELFPYVQQLHGLEIVIGFLVRLRGSHFSIVSTSSA